MNAYKECYDKIRCALNDKNGVLSFESFEIAGAPECKEMEKTIRKYLLGRPLAYVDLEYLKKIKCKENGKCILALIQLIQEYKDLFISSNKYEETKC